MRVIRNLLPLQARLSFIAHMSGAICNIAFFPESMYIGVLSRAWPLAITRLSNLFHHFFCGRHTEVTHALSPLQSILYLADKAGKSALSYDEDTQTLTMPGAGVSQRAVGAGNAIYVEENIKLLVHFDGTFYRRQLTCNVNIVQLHLRAHICCIR